MGDPDWSKSPSPALAFLMTYGWAVLIVLIAIATLVYFEVLSPDWVKNDESCYDLGYVHQVWHQEDDIFYCFNDSRIERGLIFPDAYKLENKTLVEIRT